MRKLNSYIPVFILIVSTLLISCGDDPPTGSGVPPQADTSTFTYPFTIGSTWSYNRTFSVENIRPDSIRHYFTSYPHYSTGTVTVLYDTLINGVTTRCFLEGYYEVHGSDTVTWKKRLYYGNYDTALVCFATRGRLGVMGIPYSVQPATGFSKYGKRFSSISEITSYIETGSIPYESEQMYLENPPAVSLKYPIVTGTEWVSKYSKGVPWSYKKYLSFVIEYINGIPVSCIKTERRLPAFGETECYEYYSKFGQIKRNYLFRDMIVTTKWMPDGAGYADIRDVYNISSYNIVNP
jgi:hypothetical protein